MSWSGQVAGLELLGSTVLGTAAVSTSILTIPPRDVLLIHFRITGYASADIAGFRFGGTAGAVDSGTNYWSRFLSSAAGATTFTNVQNVSPTSPASTGIRVESTATTLGRSGTLFVSNFATASKPVVINVETATGAAATAGALVIAGGEWVNTTQQIIAVQMTDATNGSANLNVGSGFAVYGRNL